MANFTALKTAINNAIKTNGNEEITGAILQAILDAMVETLGDSAITDLENAITAEVTNRENAVGGVADDLAAEVQARQALDYNVNNRINAEEYNRQNADAALSQTMNQGFQTLGSQMNALNAAISALNAAYQNGYLYGGIATPSSSPSNNKCFYIALQGGTYTNFGGVGVVEGINIIKNDSGWKVEHIYDQTTLLNEFYLLRQQVIRAISSIDPIVIQGDVTNAPDEEDLTSNAQNLLKFKDRAYSPLNFSGLGMKILRKNIAPLSDSAAFNGFVEGVTAEETLAGTPELIFWDRMNTRFIGIKDGIYYAAWTDDDNYVPVSTSLVYMYNGTPYRWDGSDFIVDETEVPNLVNCLTQDMINEANTIYIIRYDYTLKENITIPANCVLEFDGGSLSNGTIMVNSHTNIISAILNECMLSNVYGSEDIIIDNAKVSFSNKQDANTNPDIFCTIYGVNGLKILNSTFKLINNAGCIYIKDCTNIVVDGNNILGNINLSVERQRNSSGVFFNYGTKNITVTNNDVSYFGIGIGGDSQSTAELGNCENVNITNNIVHHCYCHGIMVYSSQHHDLIGHYVINNIISNNIVHHIQGSYVNSSASPTKTMGSGIYIEQTSRTICEGNDVYDVCIDNNNPFTLLAAAISVKSDYCICGNNRIENSGAFGISINGNYNIISNNNILNTAKKGVFVAKGNYNQIVNNKVITTNDYGIKLGKDQDKTINGTIVRGNQIAGVVGMGIYVLNTATNSIISENTIENATTQGIFSSGDNTTIDGNIINSNINTSKGIDCRSENFIVKNNQINITSSLTRVNYGSCKSVNSFNNTKYSYIYADDSDIKAITLQPSATSPYVIDNVMYNNEVIRYIISGNGTVGGLKNVIPGSIVYIYTESEVLFKSGVAVGGDNWNFRLGSDITTFGRSCIVFFAALNHILVPISIEINIVNRKGTNPPASIPAGNIGFMYYNTNINRPTYWDNNKYLESDGAAAAVKRSGTFAEKPSSADIYVGFAYFCTDKQTTEGVTNGIVIYHKGSDVWVDALGRVVS